MDQSGSDQELPRYTPDDPRIIGDFLCKTLIDNTETNLVASLYVDAPQVAVKSRHHDTSLYASLSTNTNPSRPPFRRRLKHGYETPHSAPDPARRSGPLPCLRRHPLLHAAPYRLCPPTERAVPARPVRCVRNGTHLVGYASRQNRVVAAPDGCGSAAPGPRSSSPTATRNSSTTGPAK